MVPHDYGSLTPEMEVRPNKMQEEALKGLNEHRSRGARGRY